MFNNLQERISYYRKKCELTQEELAEKCSVSPQAVSKWENGLTAPDISLLPRLAEIFNCSIDELLGREKPKTAILANNDYDLTKAIMKIHVKSHTGDNVNMNLPLAIAKIVLNSGGFKIGMSEDILDGIDFDQIMSMVSAGAIGKLIEVESGDGDVVEIWVE